MKKIINIFAILLTLTLLFGCFGQLSEVESISLNYQLKEQYNLGEEVDLSGAQVKVTKTDGSTFYVDLTHSSIKVVSGLVDGTKLDTSTLGTNTFKITYEGVSFSIQFTVVVAGTWDGTTLKQVTAVQNEEGKDVYTITEAAELAWLGYYSQTHDLRNVIINIKNDIDMGNREWDEIKYLAHSTIDGYISESKNATIYGLTYGLVYKTINSIFRNLNFVYDIDTKDAAYGIVVVVRPEGDDETPYSGETRETIFENINASGDIFALEDASVFIGFGYVYNYGIREKISFKNCTSSVNLTAHGPNSGQLIGHSNFFDLYLDQTTYYGIEKTITTSAGSTGKYIGNTNGVDIFVESTTESGTYAKLSTTTSPTQAQFNTANSTKNNATPTPQVYSEEDHFGKYVSVAKAEGAYTVQAKLTYWVGAAYDRNITVRVNVESLETGSMVFLPIKFQYVSQNPDSVNWVNYIYNNEGSKSDSYGPFSLGANVQMTVFQFDENNGFITASQWTYTNKPNR